MAPAVFVRIGNGVGVAMTGHPRIEGGVFLGARSAPSGVGETPVIGCGLGFVGGMAMWLRARVDQGNSSGVCFAGPGIKVKIGEVADGSPAPKKGLSCSPLLLGSRPAVQAPAMAIAITAGLPSGDHAVGDFIHYPVGIIAQLHGLRHLRPNHRSTVPMR